MRAPPDSDLLSRNDAEQLASMYQAWLTQSGRVLSAIDRLEADGFLIEGADEFRRRCREVRLMNFDFDRIEASLAAALAGRVRPLREAADELRRRRDRSSA
jgi:DNA-binding MarR family transcriptional regulator